MAIVAYEPLNSRRITSGRNPSGEIDFRVEGAEDEAAARTALLAESPRFLVVPGEDGVLVKLTRTGITPTADGLDYNVTVQYAQVPDAETARVSFDTGSGSIRLRQSLATRGYPIGLPTHGGAINMKKDGTVDGVDIHGGPMQFSIHQSIPAIELTENLVRLLLVMRFTTNQSPWRGYAEGEVLFIDALGNERGDGMVDMDFKFAAAPNVYNQTMRSDTDELGLPQDPIEYSKEGWEYAEPIYMDAEIESQHRVVTKLAGVLIHQVYRKTDFSQLPIRL